jgi:hypothetical protein
MTNIIEDIHREFEESLIAWMYQMHGPLVAKDHLWRELGYSSSVALRMAVNRGTVPVTLMELPHRHGRFGLTEEIAKWLLSQRIKNSRSPLERTVMHFDEDRATQGALLHERELLALLQMEARGELLDADMKCQIPFPVFTIDHRQTKLFALACEVPSSCFK